MDPSMVLQMLFQQQAPGFQPGGSRAIEIHRSGHVSSNEFGPSSGVLVARVRACVKPN